MLIYTKWEDWSLTITNSVHCLLKALKLQVILFGEQFATSMSIITLNKWNLLYLSWPWAAAPCSGVKPSILAILTSPPRSKSNSKQSADRKHTKLTVIKSTKNLSFKRERTAGLGFIELLKHKKWPSSTKLCLNQSWAGNICILHNNQFSSAAPHIWNPQPICLRSCCCTTKLKSLLKTNFVGPVFFCLVWFFILLHLEHPARWICLLLLTFPWSGRFSNLFIRICKQ